MALQAPMVNNQMAAMGLPQQKSSGFLGGLSNFLLGSPASTTQLQRFTPEQQSSLNQLLNFGTQQASSSLNPEALQQRITRQYNEEIIPSIAARFAGMGSGSKGSSGLQSALTGAGTDLAERLAALQYQTGLQQQRHGLSLASLGLTPQFENIYNPATTGFLGNIAATAAPAIGAQVPGGLGLLLPLLQALLGGQY